MLKQEKEGTIVEYACLISLLNMADVAERGEEKERQSAPPSSEMDKAQTYGIFGTEHRQCLGAPLSQMWATFRTECRKLEPRVSEGGGEGVRPRRLP